MDTVAGNQNRRRRDWSSLNYDLTDHIFRKYLPFPDLLRCRYVCRSWRSVSRTIFSSLPVNSPVLVLPKLYLPQKIITSDEESCHLFFQACFPTQLCCFFNPVTCELYPVSEKSKQLLKGRFVLGLSEGWALFKGDIDLVLFNAPTGISIRMQCSEAGFFSIKTAAFWGGDPILDPKNSSSHGIVAIRGSYSSPDISFAIWGDTLFRYTSQSSLYPAHDVIYFNGLVYGVFGTGFIQCWEGVGCGFKGLTQIKKDEKEEEEGGGGGERIVEESCAKWNSRWLREKEVGAPLPRSRLQWWLVKLRLVDSSGELWLVSKLGSQTQSQIGVYKMDFKERKWVEMDSLGDQVVFMCENQIIAFSPLGHSEYKRNCVYFEDYGLADYNRCIYVYNLVDGSITNCSYRT